MDVLDELAAREAIRQQLCNYGRGVDRRDRDLLRSVWHDDGTLDYSLPGVTTPDQLIEALWSTDVTTDVWLHPLTAIAIEVQGDRAASEAYVSARSYRSSSKTQVQETLIHARYLDGWSKRDGRWAIDHRKAITDIRITRQIEGEVWRSQGRPDKSDPSYAVFAALREGRAFG
ncbi:MAG: nuclear transport factor 2 family protein [Novosphingobium sp.]|nr:nuclear transport factor 2 family protein [Novosphingobium sp.]